MNKIPIHMKYIKNKIKKSALFLASIHSSTHTIMISNLSDRIRFTGNLMFLSFNLAYFYVMSINREKKVKLPN